MTETYSPHLTFAMRRKIEGKTVVAFREVDGWPTLIMGDGTTLTLTTPGESIEYTVTDLQSHEPPRNSGEGTAVNGPMPLGEKPEALE
jgi:hypothetical protein